MPKQEKWQGIPIYDFDDLPPAPDGAAKGYSPPTSTERMEVEGVFAPPSQMEVYPESELEDRLKAQWERKESLYHLWQIADNGKQPEVFSQNGQGYCVPPGTRVRMADGSVKNIETVRLLDEVLTAEGNVGRVLQCHVREHAGEMVTVKTYGHGHLRLTPNHEIMTRRGYVPSGELTADDWIAVPRYAAKTCAIVLTAQHVRAARRPLVIYGHEQERHFFKEVPDVIELTPGVGRIFGLWLAEGYIEAKKGNVLWAFDVSETDTLAAEVVTLLRQEWGAEATTEPGPGSNVTLVKLTGKLWCELFKSLCGRLAGGKRVHSDLLGGPTEFLGGLFWGWMAGDGCRRETGRCAVYYRGATISHDLAMNMFDIANALGLNPGILKEKPQKNSHAKTRQPIWKITVIPSPSDRRPNYRMECDDARMWRRVRLIERDSYSGTVFNLGVEGDNSYVAEGVGVHNCWAYSTTNALMFARCAAGMPFVRLSAHSVAWTIKNGRDQGGWCGESAKFIFDRGVVPESIWPARGMRDYGGWDEAKKYRIDEEWRDVAKPIYGQQLTAQQIVTCALNNQPMACDDNEWSHSVCYPACAPIEKGVIGRMGWNSWANWGDKGWFISRSQRLPFQPDGAIAIRTVTAL